MEAEFLVLGAGQEVGRSCVVLYCNGVNIMFDCGLHMGKRGNDRLPHLHVLGSTDDINAHIHLVVITHFHLDHIGALPYLTEVLGYKGPIIMAHATKVISPLILEDYYSICQGRGDVLYPLRHIETCLGRAMGVNVEQTIHLPGVTITAYYAGHVIGAVMFHCQIGSASVLYTGDYNMVADRLLGSARVPRLRPDVLISESTYAVTLRDPRRSRERKLLDMIHSTIRHGGKVLVPVFAVGSAQEMSLLITSFWERLDLQVPVYMTEGMATRAAALYETLSRWGSQGFQHAKEAGNRAAGATPRIRMWRSELMFNPGPAVLFATPGMLQGGVSLTVFKEWAQDSNNMVLIPGSCASGSIGHKLMTASKANGGRCVKVDGNTEVIVRCKVENLTFSAHTDSKGVMDLAQRVRPRATILVHGESHHVEFLMQRLNESMNIPCYAPVTGQSIHIALKPMVPVSVSGACIAHAQRSCGKRILSEHLMGFQEVDCILKASSDTKEPAFGIEALLQHPPMCQEGELQAEGRVQGLQHRDGHKLTLCTTSEAQAESLEHEFSVCGSLTWDSVLREGHLITGEGCMLEKVDCKVVDQVERMVTFHTDNDIGWMWDILWAEDVNKCTTVQI